MVRLFLILSFALILPLRVFAVECPGNTQDMRYRAYFYQYYYGVSCAAVGAALPELHGKTVTIENENNSTCGWATMYTNASHNNSQTAFIYRASSTYNAGSGCPPNSDTVVNSAGETKWCSSPQPDPVYNLENCINSWSVMQGDCGGFPEDCEAEGGTFGFYTGTGGKPRPVCLPATDSPTPPECGVDGFICNDPIPSTGIGTVVSIDDPAAPTPPPPSTSNQTAAGAGSKPGTDSVTGQPCNAADGGTCVANDTNGDGVCDPATEPNCKTKDEGAKGECDPESSNYQSCVGLLQADPGMEAHGKAAMNAARDNAVNKWEQTAGAALSDNQIGTDPGGLLNVVKYFVPINVVCTDVMFLVKGEEFRISCADTEILRQILGWALYCLGAMSIWSIFTRVKEN